MKKIILSFTVLAILCSCSNPQNDIKKYLEKNTSVLNSLEFIEVADVDSVYSPFRELISASVWCSAAKSEISRSWSESTEDNFREKALALEDSLKGEYDRVIEILLNAERVLNTKEFNLEVAPHNRIGVKAKYRVNGRLRTDWFYYEKDGTIQSSTIDIERMYRNISDCILEYNADIRKYKRSWY